MTDPRAVVGTVLVGLGLAGSAVREEAPRPVAERVVRLEGAVARPGWYEAEQLGRAVAEAGGGVAFAEAPFGDRDRVRVFGGWALVGAPPAPVVPVAWTPGKVRLNRASVAELEALPSIGPVLARRIVAGRPYRSLADLDRVKGVGPRTLARLRPLVAP